MAITASILESIFEAARRATRTRPLHVGLAALLPFLACSRPPAVAITAEQLPSQSRSLAVAVTRTVAGVGEQASAEPLTTYDLPSPTPSRQSFLLNLPRDFGGPLSVHLAAFGGGSGAGCLLGVGSRSFDFTPQPYDDSRVVPIDRDLMDHDCETADAALPRLIRATPKAVSTAGGELVTLHGWGFLPGTELSFADSKSTDVRYVSAFELQATAPARTRPGNVALRALLPGGAATSRDNLLSYRYSTIEFQAQPAYTVPFPLARVEFGDLDANGSFDLMFSYGAMSRNVVTTVLLPQADTQDHFIGTEPVPSVLADLDRDGKLDILSGLGPTMKLVTLRNSGDGVNFDAAVSYNVAVTPSRIIGADLDGDGAAEAVVLSTSSRTLQFYPNNGSGTFGAPRALTLNQSMTPFDLASIDVNRDGLRDVLVIDRDKAQVEVMFNGVGGMAGRFFTSDSTALVGNLDAPASSATVWDVDGDGAGDALIALESAGKVMALYSRPRLGLTIEPIATCATPRVAAMGDVDADGVREILVACAAERQIQILSRTATGSYQEIARTPIPSGLTNLLHIVAADFSGDGLVDIMAAASNGFGLIENRSH